jgi:hypothetical protein
MGRMRLTEHLRFIYGLLKGCMVHLWTVSRTYDQFGALFRKQSRWYLGGDFLYIFLHLLWFY